VETVLLATWSEKFVRSDRERCGLALRLRAPNSNGYEIMDPDDDKDKDKDKDHKKDDADREPRRVPRSPRREPTPGPRKPRRPGDR
jgi:hypothetical protein